MLGAAGLPPNRRMNADDLRVIAEWLTELLHPVRVARDRATDPSVVPRAMCVL